MTTLDTTMKEIRKLMMEHSGREYFELSRTTLSYLLNNLQRYRIIEEEMKKKVGRGEKPTPQSVINMINDRHKLVNLYYVYPEVSMICKHQVNHNLFPSLN